MYPTDDFTHTTHPPHVTENVRRMLDAHNRLRRNEGVWLPDLSWDDELARYAQAKADYLAHHYGGCLTTMWVLQTRVMGKICSGVATRTTTRLTPYSPGMTKNPTIPGP